MPLTAEDMATLSAVISQTVSAVLQAQHQQRPQTTTQAQAIPAGKIEERHYRKLGQFGGQFGGQNWKDWAFQFRSATRSSSQKAYKILEWAEQQSTEIEDFSEYEGDDEESDQICAQLFNVITTMVTGEPLQLMHNCDFNGAEAWRRLSKRYSPTSPLRMMQLMLQVVSPERAKHVKDIPNIVERWETRVHMLERDFKESVSSKMKAAILISFLPTELRDALIQQAEKLVVYQPTKEKVMSIDIQHDTLPPSLM